MKVWSTIAERGCASALAVALMSVSAAACAQQQVDPAPPSTASPTEKPPPTSPAAKTDRKPVSAKYKHEAEKAYLEGARAIERKDLRAAYDSFASAADLDPENTQYSAAREIAREHLVTLLVQEADKARLTGHSEESRSKLEEAFALDPKDPIVTQHIDAIAGDRLNVIQLTDEHGDDVAPPVELAPKNAKQSFHLRTSSHELMRQVLTAYGVTPVLDSSLQQQSLRFDADDVDFEQAANMVKMLTGTFFVPLDPQRVLVAKDTKENRQKYERLLVESIYLPGLTSTELADMANLARNIFETPVAVTQTQRGILTVRAPETRMHALNATLSDLLDGRSQIDLEVRLYEVDKTRTTNIGVVLPQQTTIFNVQSELNQLVQNDSSLINQIISSGLAQPGDYAAILAILVASGQLSGSVLTQAFRTFGGGITQFGYEPGGVTGNLALNSSDVRTIDALTMRVQDQETGTFVAGTRYPIITSTYSTGGSSLNIPGINSAGISSALSGLGVNLSGLSTAQTTIPQIQYEDLGLTFKATPRIQHGGEVTLKMDLKFEALGGSSINNIPILNSRVYTGIVTLPVGNSALIVSSLSRSESNAVSGIPGLSELPGLQSTTNDLRQYDVSNLVLLVTPHILRRSHVEVAGREIVLPKHD